MNVRDEFLPVATSLLAEFGSAATLTRSLPATQTDKFSTLASTSSSTTTTTISTMAVVQDQQIVNQQGALISLSTAILLDEPRQGDTLTMGSMTWRVGQVTITAPQGQAIIYTAVLS